MKRLIVLLILLAVRASATNHYILPSPGGGSGTTGADWSHACSGFTGNCAPGSMVRGDTYYVGGGSYAGNYTFTVTASGSTYITIQGATAANAGGATGWSSSYDVSTTPATFSGGVTFNTSYWKFDGTVGPNFDLTPSHYGFSFGSGQSQVLGIGTAGSPGNCGSATSYVTMSHFYSQAPSSDVEKEWMEGNTYGGVLSNVTLSHYLIDRYQGLLMTKSGGCSGTPYANWLIEYGIDLNDYSSSGGGTNNNHGELIDTNERSMSGMIFRYNYVSGFSNPTYPTGGPANGSNFNGSGSTATIVGNNSALIGSYIYGNVFNNVYNGNGTISDTTPNGAGDIQNNTVINNTFTYDYTSDATLLQSNNANSTGNVAYNNIFYNIDLGGNSAFNISFQTHDYDYYIGTYGSIPTETHRQSGTANPFVNVNSDTWAGYQLTSDTSAGLAVTNWSTLPSGCTVGVNCMNVDANGVVRGVNGTIDRGALQIASSATSPTVTTTMASSITSTTASAGGVVTSNGGASVTSEGTCYAATANPTTPCTSDGTATPFTSSITGLAPGTLYHYRAFATNSVGTGYGSDLTFTTTVSCTGTCVNGNFVLSGSVTVGPSFSVSGGPLTYPARTDNCVHGYSTNAITVAPFYNPAKETCINGATTGQSGSALIFQAGASDPLPFNRLDAGTNPAVANTSFVDPDFNSYSIFVTDPSTNGTYGTSWNMGSGGGYDAFGMGQSNGSDTLLSFANGGTVPYFVHVIESRFLAHTCSTSNKCAIVSNIHGAGCDPGSTCTNTQITTSGSNTFSRNPSNQPNTLFEFYQGRVYKDTWTSSLTGGIPNGTSDSVTRTLWVDFTSDNGGSIPCSVLPVGYNVRWTSILDFADDDSVTLAMSGGGPWVAGATYTTDNFIMPVNHVTSPNNIQYYMFQVTTPGTAATVEPDWSTNCPAAGNTCTDANGVVYLNIGKVDGQGPGFDVIHFDPHRGCSRDNTRLSKRYRGTNEGPNWPGAGTPDAAGQWVTDDAVVGYRMSGSGYTVGTFVNLTDEFTLHAAGSYLNSEYGHIGPSGAGAINNTFGNGSCTPPTAYTTFPGWPNNIAWSSSYNTPTGYVNGNYVVSPTDHNYYKKIGAGTGLTTDPVSDSTNWSFQAALCYNYIADWYSNVMRINTEIGPGYGGDGHSTIGYVYDWRGGTYFSHYLYNPNCNTTTGTCAGLNVGHPNPNIQALTLSLPSDGHPTYRNDGTLDAQPIIDPTFNAPSWGGVSLMPTCYGVGGTSGYCSAGYGEMLGFSTDGLQTLYRFGHNFNTGSNPGFGTQSDIGVVSQDGKMLAWSSDFMNTRGDGSNSLNTTTCQNPVRGQYGPGSGQCVSLSDYVFPTTSNANGSIFKITSTGSAVQGSCASGQVTEGTVPAWSGCQTGASTCTDSVGIVFTNEQPNSCRPDIGLMDLLSAHPAP